MFCVGSEIQNERWLTTTCASPLSDCSSIRSRPSSDSHSRPLAPCRIGSLLWPVKSEESIRLLVKLMLAEIPVTFGADSA